MMFIDEYSEVSSLFNWVCSLLQDLAATSLGNSFVSVFGRMFIMGLNGALDTLASQVRLTVQLEHM